MDVDGCGRSKILPAGRSRLKVRAAGRFGGQVTYGFEYVVGFDLSKKKKSFRGGDINAGRAVAPQRTTAKALAATLEGTTDESWEPSFCRMIETVLKDHDSDPLLRHFLLRKIVAVGCKGSLCLQKGFGGYVELLKNSKVPADGQLGRSGQLRGRGATSSGGGRTGQVAKLRRRAE